MFYVYVLRSQMDSGFYIGYTNDLRARLRQHKAGKCCATAHRNPWKLIYDEAYLNQADAMGPRAVLEKRRWPRISQSTIEELPRKI